MSRTTVTGNGLAWGDMVKKSALLKEIEFHPDAMERFERAAKVVVKSPPQHRIAKKKAPKEKAKKTSAQRQQQQRS
jgi:hypothetical protein